MSKITTREDTTLSIYFFLTYSGRNTKTLPIWCSMIIDAINPNTNKNACGFVTYCHRNKGDNSVYKSVS